MKSSNTMTIRNITKYKRNAMSMIMKLVHSPKSNTVYWQYIYIYSMVTCKGEISVVKVYKGNHVLNYL